MYELHVTYPGVLIRLSESEKRAENGEKHPENQWHDRRRGKEQEDS